jgi:hypothetical protein
VAAPGSIGPALPVMPLMMPIAMVPPFRGSPVRRSG